MSAPTIAGYTSAMHSTSLTRTPALTRTGARAVASLAALLLLASCASPVNNTLSLDHYTPAAVALSAEPAPSVDAPSIDSPYRTGWQSRRIVVPIARPWSQPSLRLGDWAARSDRDRARFPFPPATAMDVGEDVAFPGVPVFYELAVAAIELATAVPRTLLYTSYAPAQEALDPFERAPAWEQPAFVPKPAQPTMLRGAPAVGSDAPAGPSPSP